jgi:hypothetical protein
MYSVFNPTEGILKIMGPHENLSEDLSNNRVSIASKIVTFFLFSDRSRPPSLKGVRHIGQLKG